MDPCNHEVRWHLPTGVTNRILASSLHLLPKSAVSLLNSINTLDFPAPHIDFCKISPNGDYQRLSTSGLHETLTQALLEQKEQKPPPTSHNGVNSWRLTIPSSQQNCNHRIWLSRPRCEATSSPIMLIFNWWILPPPLGSLPAQITPGGPGHGSWVMPCLISGL